MKIPPELQESLRDSLALCKANVERPPLGTSYGSIFRTPALLPTAAKLVADVSDVHRVRSKSYTSALTAFNAAKRSLRSSEIPAEQQGVRDALVVSTRIGVCLGDGLVPKETAGFFSAHKEFGTEELPPWDTWFGVTERGKYIELLSWVPGWAEPIVEKAIAADYLQMYLLHR